MFRYILRYILNDNDKNPSIPYVFFDLEQFINLLHFISPIASWVYFKYKGSNNIKRREGAGREGKRKKSQLEGKRGGRGRGGDRGEGEMPGGCGRKEGDDSAQTSKRSL